MSYAIDGRCHNANVGAYGHECGKPAVWTAENTSGFRSGFCARCRAEGDEARGFHGWQPYNQAREVMIAVNRNHRDASGWIDEAAMCALFETYNLPLEDRTRIWRELTAATEELPSPAEVVPLVLDGVPSLSPAVVYAAGIMEPPPRDLLTVKGWGGVPMARIEVPAAGPFMGAMALGAGPLGMLMLMPRPPDDEAATIPPHFDAALAEEL